MLQPVPHAQQHLPFKESLVKVLVTQGTLTATDSAVNAHLDVLTVLVLLNATHAMMDTSLTPPVVNVSQDVPLETTLLQENAYNVLDVDHAQMEHHV